MPEQSDDSDQSQEPNRTDEAPPFGRSWTMLYAVVLVNLAVLIVLFYIFTRAFA
ncbi:MAG: hypothetical protein LC802_06465 [Acidobacteria bacterium]|nr:hypothetical protein [Acidobacteriota bacterium]